MLTNDKQMVFNHDQIEEIVFMGYINIEEQDFKLQLYAEMEEKESSTEASTESNNN